MFMMAPTPMLDHEKPFCAGAIVDFEDEPSLNFLRFRFVGF